MSDNNDSTLVKDWQSFLQGFLAGALSKDKILEVVAWQTDPGWAPYIVVKTSTGETLSITVIVKEGKWLGDGAEKEEGKPE